MSNKLGFVFDFEIVGLDGTVRDKFSQENIIPDVGRDYMLSAALAGGSAISSWYIGLYENVRVPVASDTMVTLLADAGEIIDYSGTPRLTLTADPISGGVFSNSVTKAEFTFTAAKTVRGGFITSNSVKSNTAGTLLSAVQLPTAKTMAIGEVLRCTAGLVFYTS